MYVCINILLHNNVTANKIMVITTIYNLLV